MTRRTFLAAAAILVAVGAAVRVHNGLQFPALTGYDGFAHFTYVWYLSATGRVPLPTAGWEFFQPPSGFMKNSQHATRSGRWGAPMESKNNTLRSERKRRCSTPWCSDCSQEGGELEDG